MFDDIIGTPLHVWGGELEFVVCLDFDLGPGHDK
jgi:hypothetical protein